MNKPFHKPSVKKPPHVKKFSTQRYSSLCRDSKCPTIWMLVHCGAGTSLGPQLGTSRLSGRPAFGLTPSEPRGPSLRPLGSSCPSVNSIHSWVFTITALGAVVLSKELLFRLLASQNTKYKLCSLAEEFWPSGKWFLELTLLVPEFFLSFYVLI